MTALRFLVSGLALILIVLLGYADRMNLARVRFAISPLGHGIAYLLGGILIVLGIRELIYMRKR